MLRKIGIISCILRIVIAVRSPTFEHIQENNLSNLTAALKTGYRTFCASQIDHGVLSLHGEGDPHDAMVELHIGYRNTTSSLKNIHKIISQELDRSKKTILYINGYINDEYDVLNNVRKIAKCSAAYNVLILNFACSLQMLYNTAVYNSPIFTYAVLKILDKLIETRIPKQHVILVGHSQGAQIASAAAKLFHQEHGWKLQLLVALDPVIPCSPTRQYVTPNLAEHVLVIHTNCGDFGLEYALGTVDYYPNGVEKLQPGCNDQVCSHARAVEIFTEAVCNPGSFLAVKCKDWKTFQQNMCIAGGVIPICLRMHPGVKGRYFSITRQHSPYGMGFAGISTNKLQRWWNHGI